MTSSPLSQEHPDHRLMELIHAIVADDAPEVLRLLEASPALAVQRIVGGATRADAITYFIRELAHYVYAGDTALHLAAAAQRVKLVELLLARGADAKARNRRGAEPLHYAADGGPDSPAWNPKTQAALVKRLVAAGADPNAFDKSGVAPLHRAVRSRFTPAVKALLEHGAQPQLANKNGSTPLHLAVQTTGKSGSGSPGAKEQQAEIIRLLRQHGASPEDQDAKGKTVRECAKSDWIRELLD